MTLNAVVSSMVTDGSECYDICQGYTKVTWRGVVDSRVTLMSFSAVLGNRVISIIYIYGRITPTWTLGAGMVTLS